MRNQVINFSEGSKKKKKIKVTVKCLKNYILALNLIKI